MGVIDENTKNNLSACFRWKPLNSSCKRERQKKYPRVSTDSLQASLRLGLRNFRGNFLITLFQELPNEQNPRCFDF